MIDRRSGLLAGQQAADDVEIAFRKFFAILVSAHLAAM